MQKTGLIRISDQCGLKSTRIAKEQPVSLYRNLLVKLVREIGMSPPHLERRLCYDQKNERQIAIQQAAVKAGISLRESAIRLRKREEQELRAFKTVHVKTFSMPIPKTVKTTTPERYRQVRLNMYTEMIAQLNKYGDREETLWAEKEKEDYNEVRRVLRDVLEFLLI